MSCSTSAYLIPPPERGPAHFIFRLSTGLFVPIHSLFQAIDHDLSAPEIDSKIDTLQLALEIFSSKPTSPSLGAVVQQGQRILAGLFREEERRRTARAARALMLASTGRLDESTMGGGGQDDEDEATETFAEVLQRIARNLNTDSAPHRGTPPPTRNIPSKASAARFTSATFPPTAPSTLPPFDEQSVPVDASNVHISTLDRDVDERGPSTTAMATTRVNGVDGNSHEYSAANDEAQTWPFERLANAVDPLSLQFFHELDVGLPTNHLSFNLDPVTSSLGPAGGDAREQSTQNDPVADAAAFWGSGSRAAEFAATSAGLGGGGVPGVGSLGGYGSLQNAEWHPQADWSLDTLGLGGGW